MTDNFGRIWFVYTGQDQSEIPKYVTHVRMDPSVTRIAKAAFRDCKFLTDFKFSKGLLEVIEADAFWDCKSLKHLSIPSTVTTIGSGAFKGCSSLTSIELPEALQVVEDEMFMGCTSLEFLRIPLSVKQIREKAFSDCHSLQSVELAPDLERLGKQCFRGCRALVNILLPSSVSCDGHNLFQGCFMILRTYLYEIADIDTYNNSVAQGDEDINNILVSAIQKRYRYLPVHELCYNQSFHPTEYSIEEIRKMAVDDKVDALDMTPFHILALSAKPEVSLFKELAKHYPLEVLERGDEKNTTPLYYLLKSFMPGAAACAEWLIQVSILDRVDRLCLQKWREHIVRKVEELHREEDNNTAHLIAEIYILLDKYERLEGLSLLEMFLWDMRISSAHSALEGNCKAGGLTSKRTGLGGIGKNACRVRSGADIVIPNVLSFLDKSEEAY